MDNVVDKVAKQHGLNPDVVKAICLVESGWDTFAVRYEPNWRWLLKPGEWAKRVGTTEKTEVVLQSCSWGLMQVMGTVARELGFRGDFPQLCQPEVGVHYGCLKLKQLLTKYPALPDALAAYNAGNPKFAAGKAYATKVIGFV